MTRKRKDRNEETQTLILDSRNQDRRSEDGDEDDNNSVEEEEEREGEGEAVKGFFACYLLCSLSPRFKGHTYIGFTVNPRRRIRQHNGEITSGAWRTKRKRPWEMVLCVYGFPTNVSALQFEWAWQHPKESLCVRQAAASLKSHSGIANKIKLVYLMLNLSPWQSMKLTVNFFSTKYTKHSVGCSSLPKQMRVKVCPMDELPCYVGGVLLDEDNADEDEDHQYDPHPSNIVKISHDGLRGKAASREKDLIEPHARQKEQTLPFSLVDSPVMPVSIPTSEDGFGKTNENDNLFQFSEERSNYERLSTYCKLIASTASEIDQLPSTGNHSSTSDQSRTSSDFIENCLLKQSTELESAISVSKPEEQLQYARSLFCSSEFDSTKQKDSFILPDEDHRVTFNLLDSPPSSSTISFTEKVTTVDDKIPCRLFQGNKSKQRRGRERQLATLLKDKDDQQLSTNSFSHGVEVINVATPSPERATPFLLRNNKASLISYEIIDLTNSPGYIQL
ncbi:hypothetical protein Sjap_000907 [Stephania japonica]|uniref:Structure-specific endonuclease subunit SLX1 homolog n=1 Tax=Stephania japonica TaxID=461633 RepID=A0AAP0PR69_9MAGN